MSNTLDSIRKAVKSNPTAKENKPKRIDSSMLPFSKEYQTRKSATSKKKK